MIINDTSNREDLTEDDVKRLLDDKKAIVTKDTLKHINSTNQDPLFSDISFRNVLIDFSGIRKKKSSSVIEYVNAVKYVALIESRVSKFNAYTRVFDYREIVKYGLRDGKGSDNWDKLVKSSNRYANNPLVVEIMKASDTPLSILYQGTRHTAVEVLEDEMLNASSSRDRIEAAKTILKEIPAHIQEKVEDSSASNQVINNIQFINQQLYHNAENQLKMLEKGFNIEEIQKLNITTENKAIDE